MKILLISNGYPPDQWAGTETYTAGIAQALHAQGHQVQILCGGKWQKGAHYWNGYSDHLEQGIPCRRLHLNWTKAPDPFRYLYDNPVVADFLRGYLDEIQPDLVHITSCERLSAGTLNVVKEAGLPLVLSLTDFWFLCPRITLLRSDGDNCDGQTTPWDCLECQLRHSRVYRWSQRLLPEATFEHVFTGISKRPELTRLRGLRGMAGDMEGRKDALYQAFCQADVRITASRFVRDIFMANGFTEPILVQPYGHDLSWLDGHTTKTPSAVLRLGFIGQISPAKGVHLLIEAVKRLPAEVAKRCKVSIYGNMAANPDYSAQLCRLAEGAPNIEFCGIYAHADSGRVFANLDVLVVPSQWYDFPLIIHEAFAAQTPVIATRLGSMAEAVTHDVNGLLFERQNVEDLARQLQRLCEEPGLLPKLQAGMPAVKTIESEVDELIEVYKGLVPQERQSLTAMQPLANALVVPLGVLMSGTWHLDQTLWQDLGPVVAAATTSLGHLLTAAAQIVI